MNNDSLWKNNIKIQLVVQLAPVLQIHIHAHSLVGYAIIRGEINLT